ncbi:MAG: hypothetical protein WCP36_09295 [Methanomicrobiales archaeon]
MSNNFMQNKSIVKNSVKIVLCIFLLMVLVQGVQAAETYVFVTKWGIEGTGNGQFSLPYGVAIDPSGNVYITDSGNHRIQKFALNSKGTNTDAVNGDAPVEGIWN